MKHNRKKKQLTSKGIKTTIIGIFSSFILASVKIFSGIIGNSYALIADGIESIADIFTSFIVLTGLKIAVKPADDNHPYGHGKAEPLAGLIVAISLFIAALIITYQSVHEIITPHHAPAPFTLAVLVLVVGIKETLFRYIDRVGDQIESNVVKNDAWHHRSDAITSGAAFIGILIALIGGEGYEIADDIAALFASFIIIVNASKLIKPSLRELMDTSVSKEFIAELRYEAETVEGVIEVEKCFVRKMGFDFHIDAHVVVNGNLSVQKGHQIAHDVKEHLMNYNSKITDVMIHIEPDEMNLDE